MESDVLWVWLLVWKACPSCTEAVSMLMEFPVGETNLKRQSAALFLAPEIHSNLYCRLQVPSSICLPCYLHFFHLRIELAVYGHSGQLYWLLGGNSSIWLSHSTLQRLLAWWCSICTVFWKKYVIKMLLETQFHCVPGEAELHKHHQRHQCIQCKFCWGWGSGGWVPGQWRPSSL